MYPEETDVDGSRLPHLMAAICETQRIRSIVPVGIPHGCIKVGLFNKSCRAYNI